MKTPVRALALTAALLLAACSDDTTRPDAGPTGDGPQVTEGGNPDGRQVTEAGTPDGPTVTPDGPEVCVELLPTSFPQDTVLKKNCYLCKQTPKITDGVTITMEPGVKIVFDPETGLNVSSNEILIAAGTAAQPIVFTGSQKQRGGWNGVHLDGTLKPDSKLDYVTIEYAGNITSTHDNDAAALKMTADSRGVRLSITNTTIRESQGWGLYLSGSAVVGAFNKNTLTKNTLGPAWVDSAVVPTLDAASTYKGNDLDQIFVHANTTQGSWATLDVPYYVDGAILRPDGDWTIEAGATLIMATGTEIEVSGDDTALIAKGTTTAPILFTGAVKQRGSWPGIIFDGSNNTRNALAYATVEYGGTTTSDKDGAGVKLIADSHGVQLSMTNTTIRESQGWGLFLTGSSVLPGFTGNTLTKNTLGPVSVGTEAVHQLLPASTYTGNDVDRAMVRDSYVSQAVTWQKLDVPYLISNSIRPDHAVLTVSPGVTLIMDATTYIEVGGDDGGFHAAGTATAPITITGLQKTAGFWESIVFDTTLNGANALDYCTIEYGGGGAAKGWGGMIFTTSDSHGVSVSVQNSKVQNSALYGIWKSHYASINTSGTTFANNASGDIFQQP